MKQKEYPMDEDYNRALEFLTEQIAERDEMVEQLKLLPPDARPEGLRLIAELDKAIEIAEQKFAKEYESYQNLRRIEDEEKAMWAEMVRRTTMIYIHFKYRLPEKLEELKAAVLKDFTLEEEQEFYDRAAILEAGDLIAIIACEGETREQTEEFLKNYRAA